MQLYCPQVVPKAIEMCLRAGFSNNDAGQQLFIFCFIKGILSQVIREFLLLECTTKKMVAMTSKLNLFAMYR